MCEIGGTVCVHPEDHADKFRERRRRIRLAYGINAVLDILPDELPVVLTVLRMLLGPPSEDGLYGSIVWRQVGILLRNGKRQLCVYSYAPQTTDAVLNLLWRILEATDYDNAEVRR